MSIFEIIHSDHEDVKRILQRLVDSTRRARKSREEQLESLKGEILPHMHAEESLLYPFLQDESDEPDLALIAMEEHQVARNLLSDVESTSTDDDRWHAKVQVLQEIVRHHIQEEESTIFDKAMELMDEEQAEEMGERFNSLKKEAMAGFR